MHETLTNLLESYGYVALFLLVGLESLGIPLPGETALVTAAAFAGSGRLSIYRVVIIAAVAAILGDNGGYWIGRKGGLSLIRRYGRFLRVDEAKLRRAREFFDRHGGKTVFIGRFMALLRTWAAVLAGVGNMQYSTFMLYNALGGITWAVIFGALGYVFGRNLPMLQRYIGQASLASVLFAALIVALVLGARWFRTNLSRISRRVSGITERIGSSEIFQRFQKRHPEAWEFIVRRFQPGEYLGLHLTLGLLVSIAALWLFGGVTEDVIHHDPLTRLDVTLLEWLHTNSTKTGLTIFAAISSLGSAWAITALGVLISIMLAVRRYWLLLAGWMAALAGAGVLDTLLKHMIRRPRPAYASAFLHDYSFSFPSGHAMGSLVAYGMLAYLIAILWTKRWQVRVAVVITAVVLILAIGASRLYLGVHYFSDVIAGFAAGVLWLSACITGIEIVRRQRVESSTTS
ncbi:MAG: bifunctional DedA family/phosphatase PAP2 family protein [Terriglobales bacterium]